MICERCGMYEAVVDDEWCDRCIYEVEMLMAEVEGLNGDKPTEELMRHYYTPEDLEFRVEQYEQEYDLPSETLMKMWKKGMKPVDLSHYDRHLWLSYYRELMEKKYGGSAE